MNVYVVTMHIHFQQFKYNNDHFSINGMYMLQADWETRHFQKSLKFSGISENPCFIQALPEMSENVDQMSAVSWKCLKCLKSRG